MSFHASTFVKKSRKAHQCSFCGTQIVVGSSYWRNVGVADDFYSSATHTVCHGAILDCYSHENGSYEYYDDVVHEFMKDELTEAGIEVAPRCQIAELVRLYTDLKKSRKEKAKHEEEKTTT